MGRGWKTPRASVLCHLIPPSTSQEMLFFFQLKQNTELKSILVRLGPRKALC